MTIKLLVSSLLIAATLMASSVASAGVIWSGTVDDWTGTGGSYLNPPVSRPSAGEIKYDNIMSFNATTGTLTGDLVGLGQWIDVAISEIITVEETLYAVVFTPNIIDLASPFNELGGYSGSGGNFEYSMTSLNEKLITSVALDSVTIGNIGEFVTKELFDNSTFTGTPFLTLNSLNGNTDPLSGHVNFPGRQTIYVKDTLFNTGGSVITQVSNEFNTVPVPEPMTLIMLGMGLLGFGYSRRHVLSDVKGLLA